MEKIKLSFAAFDSVIRLFLIVGCSIFVSETLIMLSIDVLPPLSVLGTAFFDSTLLLILTFPVLYLTVFRPLTDRITERKLAQAAVANAKQRLDIALEGSQTNVWETDLRSNEIWLEAGWAVFLGKLRAETRTTAAELLTIVHPDDRQIVTAVAVRAMKGEVSSYAVEHRVKAASGEWKWILSRGQVIERDAGGRPQRISGTNTDITDNKNAEKALRESEALYRAVAESANDAIVTIDRAGNIVGWNRSAETIFGYTADEVKGQSLALMMPHQYRERHLAGLGRVLRTIEDPYIKGAVVELEGLRKDKSEFPLELSRAKWEGADGWYVTGVIRDISKRKRAEQSLRAAEEQFRGLVEQSIAGIYIIQDGKFAYVNPRFAEIRGYGSADELIGRENESVVAEKDRDIVAENIRRLLAGETQSLNYGFTALRKDGSTVEVEVHGARATYNDRPAIIGLMQDISEKRRAEEQIQRYVAQLETAFTSTVEVATILSEMRDPYTVGHERRVAEIAVAIGAELGIDVGRQEGLRVAGHLHDIGKIAIPAEILSKPGKLSSIELQLVQGHAQASYDVLNGVEFPWPVAQIALQHHERMDGSGYPQGLKGEAILLEARIMAVADVVEAMSSHRPYRPALGIEKALAEIERGRATLYDADVADACLRLFRENRYRLTA
jgi:PAS domain S-box-containing protein